MKIRYTLFVIVVVLGLVLAACAPAATQAPQATQPPTAKKFSMFMMPKVTGNPYFVAANKGAVDNNRQDEQEYQQYFLAQKEA